MVDEHDLNYWYALRVEEPPLSFQRGISKLITEIGGFSTLAVNISDFSRFSKKLGSPVRQLPIIPLFKVITGLFGIIAASASQRVYGAILWSPLQIINQWQGSPASRAAAFFCSSLWFLAQICNNISANSFSFANGMLYKPH